MDFPLLPCANRFCGCFCLGSGPVFVLWCFSAFCFAFSAGETQVWLGDLRVVAFCVVVVSLFCFNRFADFKDFASLYRVFAAYSHVRTEPLARHRPHSRKKKETTLEGARNQVGSQRKMFFLYGHFFIFLTKQWEEARVNIWYWTVVLLHDVRWD